ncbi:MAG: Queuine tRNA-ribosyltransferase [Phycisphaerae bacterium]|nr:Queuine tRNA-ribosyltransferase [Phycisphaerae bacterium]
MDERAFHFSILVRQGHARRGKILTPHGLIDTPAFMPVGTAATVKCLTPRQVVECGAQILLANTYHLMLRPGSPTVAALGGLHRFMGWDRPILTDSGGYQVFSLAELRRIDDDGVTFRSHVDGATMRLDPESSIRIQNELGADIIMAFDECPPLPAPREDLERAVRRTVTWAARCVACHHHSRQALYGIVQGGLDVALRRSCLRSLVELDFPGYAVGGLSVGEAPEEMARLLAEFVPEMPEERPRYLMGVGTPADLVRAVGSGIDQFDCVLPTRNGRKGYAFTSTGVLRLQNSRFKRDPGPLDPGCACECCRGFSRAYLRHLFMSRELLGGTLVSIHNLSYYQALMKRMRTAIETGQFDRWSSEFLSRPVRDDPEEP